MSLTFYCLSGSPFSWKVWLSLEHLGMAYDLKVLSAEAGELKAPPYLDVNPRGKVPAIVDDGFALWESSAIVDYLAETRSGPGRQLWPAGASERARARRIATEADGYVYPPVRRLVVELFLRRSGEPDPAAVTDSRAVLADEFARTESELTQDFLAGDEVSAADFALYPLTAILLRADAKAPQLGFRDTLGPGLRAWRTRIEALPYFARTLPPHWLKSENPS